MNISFGVKKLVDIISILEYIIIAAILAAIFPIITENEDGVNTMGKLNLTLIKSAYGTDVTAEIEGVWFKSSFIDGFEMKIARAGNKVNEKLMRKLYKPYTKQLRAGRDLPDDVSDELSNELLVETILINWRGFPSQDGDIPYSKEAAYEILKDNSLKELKKEIEEFSSDFARYQSAEDEELQGN